MVGDADDMLHGRRAVVPGCHRGDNFGEFSGTFRGKPVCPFGKVEKSSLFGEGQRNRRRNPISQYLPTSGQVT